VTPFDPGLLDSLENKIIGKVGGTVWRQVLSPTSVMRPNLRGGRWNRANVESLYCSLDPGTAAAEIDALLEAQPVPITRQRMTYSIDIELTKVADITADFAYDYDANDVPTCQMIGSAAAWLGMGGLIVPSVRAVGINLVVFVANQSPDDSLEPGESYDYPPGPPGDITWRPLS
jgi:RES domain-containing protein